jgi:general secretion pathway protein B
MAVDRGRGGGRAGRPAGLAHDDKRYAAARTGHRDACSGAAARADADACTAPTSGRARARRPRTAAAAAAAAAPGAAARPPAQLETPASAATAAARIYQQSELPDAIRAELPPLTIGGSIYSENPANRMLIVNGQLFHEGDKLAPDLFVEQIKLKAAVLRYKGYRYQTSY